MKCRCVQDLGAVTFISSITESIEKTSIYPNNVQKVVFFCVEPSCLLHIRNISIKAKCDIKVLDELFYWNEQKTSQWGKVVLFTAWKRCVQCVKRWLRIKKIFKINRKDDLLQIIQQLKHIPECFKRNLETTLTVFNGASLAFNKSSSSLF